VPFPIKVKIKVRGSGRGRPLYTGMSTKVSHRQRSSSTSFKVENDDIRAVFFNF
jgi:hypothetical protein